MFGRRYFSGSFFGGRFFGDGGLAGSGASAAEVWAYVLSNGKSAGQTLVETLAGIETLLARNCLDEQVQGAYTAADALRILLAVAAGKTTIVPLGANAATVEFQAVDDSGVVVSATMAGSERTAVTLTPTEST
jgi:hypothetical protein